jgi:hypothetical protein
VRVHGTAGWTDLVPSFPTASAEAVAAAQIQLDTTGNPVVLFSQPDASGSQTLRLARYNGTAWDTTYGSLNAVTGSGSDAQNFSLAVSAQGAPTVAWDERDPSTTMRSVYTWTSNY